MFVRACVLAGMHMGLRGCARATTFERMRARARVRARFYAWEWMRVHAGRKYFTCVLVRLKMRERTCVPTCAPAGKHVCARACVCVCVPTCAPAPFIHISHFHACSMRNSS